MTSESPVMIGGGGHALSLLSMAPSALRPDSYVDLQPSLRGLKWLGDDKTFLANYGGENVIITFVAPASCSLRPRREIISRYEDSSFSTIISPTAILAPDVFLGAGTAVFRGAIINSGAVLGGHNIVNTGAIIEHGVTSGVNVFFGPGSVTAGDVKIGENVYIGAGATIKNSVTIGNDITIGAGAVVTSNLTEPGVYVGVPARLIKKW